MPLIIGLFFLIFTATTSCYAHTEEEKLFINDFNSYLLKIKEPPYSFQDLEKGFSNSGKDVKQAQIIFFGERHQDPVMKFEQLRALELLLKPDDVVLFEGGDAGEEAFDCVNSFGNAYIQHKWFGRGRKFDSHTGERLDWSKAEKKVFYDHQIHLFHQTLEALNLTSIKLSQSLCYYWDDKKSHVWGEKDTREGHPLLEPMTKRNTAMVAEIKRHLSPNHKVIVIAGFHHLPTGDLDDFKKFLRRRFSNRKYDGIDLSSYYFLFQHSDFPYQEAQHDLGFGASKVIFNFIKDLRYAELIPHSLLQASMPCDKECE